MARSKGGSSTLPLALELLASDHRKVEDLFEQYEDGKEGDEDAKRALAEQICGELTAHTRLEEELFYPWLKENMDEMDKVEEAYVEHAGAKDLIAQIQGAAEIDDAYDAKVKVLSEYIKHHVKEEEQEIFPEVKAEQEELDELGQEMAARKAELMQELGLESEDPTAQLNAREGRGGRSQQGGQRSSR
jgi:hemerythrin-like domain-containing protein